MLELIRADLAALGVRHDVFTSEAALAADGRIEEALAELERQGWCTRASCRRPRAN